MPPEITEESSERDTMRILIASGFLLASIAAAQAQAPAAGALQTYDVPAAAKPQTIYILHRVLKPGENIGMHSHDGVELTQVLSGGFQLTADGKNTLYHAGDSFQVARGVKHDGKNVGSTDCALAVTYVLDKGAPLRNPVAQ